VAADFVQEGMRQTDLRKAAGYSKARIGRRAQVQKDAFGAVAPRCETDQL
jgi:hypothetical protein